MTQKPLMIFFLVAFFGANAQTGSTAEMADSLLKPGHFKAALVSYEFAPATMKLQQKALQHLQATQANPAAETSYLAYLVKSGKPNIRYSEDLGLTQAEFGEMLQGFRQKRHAVFNDTIPITITRSNGVIAFKTSGKLAVYNYLVIDVRKAVILFDGWKLTKELRLEGKFYAPTLHGYEASGAMEVPGHSHATGDTFAFSIGKNEDDGRPTLCLMLIKGSAQFEPVPVTILD